jgi:hypothetical protein
MTRPRLRAEKLCLMVIMVTQQEFVRKFAQVPPNKTTLRMRHNLNSKQFLG